MNDQAASLRKKVREKTNNNRIIAVASGKGGVGKTNIAINLGLALQQKGQQVLVLDADLGMANLDILLGLTPRYNLEHILKGKCKFEEAVLAGPGGIDILPGTSGIEELVHISSVETKRLIEASALMERDYDLVIIDIGAGVHYTVTNFIRACDEALIILTPEPTAIMDAYSLIKYLSIHNFKNRVSIIINQTNSSREGDDTARRMQKVIKEYLNLNIEILGYIPYDNYVRQSVKAQVPLVLNYPNSRAVTALNKIADKMLNNSDDTTTRGIKGFVYRMAGIFSRN